MAKIIVDDKEYIVKDGQNLLSAVLSQGLDLPYFCWHPAMGSVGACRQCAVKQFKDEKDKHGKIVMACMTPATDGTRISIEDPEVREFRASVIELLMVNHPHDCPICDEGGECHLQDMTVMTGHAYRAFDFKKRTYNNQNLGPFVNHEMNRCIQCYRCVRFYREVADGRDFNVFAAHDHVYFGRAQDGVLENEFSGNLVEVCPTGVFTDKTLKKHYTRKWDLRTAPSLCILCGLGCNTIPGEHAGELRRIHNRYNGEVNGYFLCDRGRYGYEFVNSNRRIRQTLKYGGGRKRGTPLRVEQALDEAVAYLKETKGVIGIGSPRASLEANFALRKLVGLENFYTGMADREQNLVQLALNILREGPARTPSLRETEQSDAVLVLGEDLTNTAPMLAFSLRQMVHRQANQILQEFQVPAWNDVAMQVLTEHEKQALYIAAPVATKLDDAASMAFQAAPDDLARLGFAVAHAIDPQAPAVADLAQSEGERAQEIAEALKSAERPLVVSGVSCGGPALLQAAANVSRALHNTGHPSGLIFVLPEANSFGLGILGGGSLQDAFRALKEGKGDLLITLENDLYRRSNRQELEDCLKAGVKHISINYLEDAMTVQANLVFPSATYAETDGTYVNNEGRAQRAYQVFAPDGEVRDAWRWLNEIMCRMGMMHKDDWKNVDDLRAELAQALPQFAPILEIAPPASFRMAGEKIARQTFRATGRTAEYANVMMDEPPPPDDPDAPFTFSMEGFHGDPPSSALIPRFWAPGWNSVQALNKFQEEIAGPLRGGDPGRRLIEPAGQTGSLAYFKEAPQPFHPQTDHWLLVFLYHIFGSEPLSMLTPGVAQLAPKPYVAINSDEADRLGVQEGEALVLSVDGENYSLPARRVDSLPAGMLGAPFGITPLAGVGSPIWVQIEKEGQAA